MANFTASNLVKAQARIASRFAEAELRAKQSPAFALANRNKDVIPGYETLRAREDRPIEVVLLPRSKRATTNERLHNHVGNRGDSFKMSPTWTGFVDNFSISLKELDNNVFTIEEVLSNHLVNASQNIHDAIETFLIDYLMAQRSTVNAGDAEGSFNAVTDAFEIALAKKDRFVQIAKAMMRKNNYRGSYDAIMTQGLFVTAEYAAAQGTANQANLGFQFQGVNILESTELADADYAGGCGLIMPAGNFGVLPWIPKQNRTGKGDYNSVLGGYGSIADPLGSGMLFAVHAYTERADTSASNGSKQDEVMQFEISVDIAPILPPINVVGESVVYEVAQLNA